MLADGWLVRGARGEGDTFMQARLTESRTPLVLLTAIPLAPGARSVHTHLLGE